MNERILRIFGLDEQSLRKWSRATGWFFIVAGLATLVTLICDQVIVTRLKTVKEQLFHQTAAAMRNDPAIPPANANVETALGLISRSYDEYISMSRDYGLLGFLCATLVIFTGIFFFRLHTILNRPGLAAAPDRKPDTAA